MWISAFAVHKCSVHPKNQDTESCLVLFCNYLLRNIPVSHMCDIVVKPGGLCALCSKNVSSVSEIVSKYIAVYKVTLLDTLS